MTKHSHHDRAKHKHKQKHRHKHRRCPKCVKACNETKQGHNGVGDALLVGMHNNSGKVNEGAYMSAGHGLANANESARALDERKRILASGHPQQLQLAVTKNEPAHTLAERKRVFATGYPQQLQPAATEKKGPRLKDGLEILVAEFVNLVWACPCFIAYSWRFSWIEQGHRDPWHWRKHNRRQLQFAVFACSHEPHRRSRKHRERQHQAMFDALEQRFAAAAPTAYALRIDCAFLFAHPENKHALRLRLVSAKADARYAVGTGAQFFLSDLDHYVRIAREQYEQALASTAGAFLPAPLLRIILRFVVVSTSVQQLAHAKLAKAQEDSASL